MTFLSIRETGSLSDRNYRRAFVQGGRVIREYDCLILYIIHDKDVAGEIASDLFTPFHADIPGGERFLQALNGRFLGFAPIS